MSKTFYTIVSFVLLTAVIGAVGYIINEKYTALAEPCRTPLLYGLGEVDERFNLARKDVLLAMLAAEDVWEDAAGEDIFSYDGSAELKVHFRYDERQADTVRAQEQEASLKEKDETHVEMQEEVKALESSYEKAAATFKANIAAYEAELEKYNKKVKKINKEGGADDKDEFDDLEEEKDDLDDRRKVIMREQDVLNGQVDILKKKISTLNTFGRTLNGEIGTFNTEHAGEKVFDQGQYYEGEIVIYQYESVGDLPLVLAHELGHARGIGHVADPSAIMHEIFREQNASNPEITQADSLGLSQACNPEVKFNLANLFQ